MKTSERMLKIALEMETVLKQNDYPRDAKEVVQRLELLAIEVSGMEPYAKAKMRQMMRKAKIFYSAKKHTGYNGGSDFLHAEMLELVNRIRTSAWLVAEHGD